MSARGSIVILAGPTASGKTGLACALARALDGEVISADSQQCYRGLDAGTAKPTREEQSQAPHHLLDIAWPEQQLDTAQFIARADAAIEDVRARGKRVLVAGGTGLWIRALVQGLALAPGRDEDFRAGFRERLAREGLPALFSELQRIDPEAARRILPGDRQRIERALEVHAKSGQTLSSLQRAHRFAERRYRARVVLLDPPRELLWQRIEARTRALFTPGPDGAEASLLRETRALLARVREIPAAGRALGIIGYGEAAAALAETEHAVASSALDAACALVAARTRQYAKRQRTWFRKDAPALDETGAPLPWPPPVDADLDAARNSLCSILREWYESAR